MVKYYNLANIIIQINSPFGFDVSGEEEFACEEQTPDFVFDFERVDNIPRLLENTEFAANVRWGHQMRKKDGSYLRAFIYEEKYYFAVTEIHEKQGICYYIDEDILAKRSENGFEPFCYLCIEEILRQFDAIVLHSSHVKYKDKGFVFSAPSQTGKSTQAELWRQYLGAQVLNGDRSILRKQDGVWHVFGCTMSGTSGIHHQGDEVLTNIVMLEQGLNNDLNPIKGRTAFMQVFPQITVPMWDEEETDHVMNLIENLIENVPVWYFSCTKDESAVRTLKNRLFPENADL